MPLVADVVLCAMSILLWLSLAQGCFWCLVQLWEGVLILSDERSPDEQLEETPQDSQTSNTAASSKQQESACEARNSDITLVEINRSLYNLSLVSKS